MTIWCDKESPNKSAWKANTAQQLAIGVEITICHSVGVFTVNLYILLSTWVRAFVLNYLRVLQLLTGTGWTAAGRCQGFKEPCLGQCHRGNLPSPWLALLRPLRSWRRVERENILGKTFWLWEIKQRLTSERWCLIPALCLLQQAPCAAFSLQFNAVHWLPLCFHHKYLLCIRLNLCLYAVFSSCHWTSVCEF